MTKETVKDIAIALIAKSGENFDMFAFDEADISDTDRDKIISEIQHKCLKMITKIEDKYNITLKNSTAEIIDSIVYE